MEQRPALRISDEDREHVVELLRQHAAAGRLDVEELGERSATVYRARTEPELRKVLADLPVLGRRSRRRLSLPRELALYLVVNGFLVVLWALTREPNPGATDRGGGEFWPVWPIAIWGFILALRWLRRRDAEPRRLPPRSR